MDGHRAHSESSRQNWSPIKSSYQMSGGIKVLTLNKVIMCALCSSIAMCAPSCVVGCIKSLSLLLKGEMGMKISL